MNSKEMAKIAYDALDDKKGVNITVIDISNISIIADYFIIAGGNNENQVKALADNVMDELGKEKISAKHVEGYNSANWILMDFNDVLVHVFNEEDRRFYQLEKIWADGKIVDVDAL